MSKVGISIKLDVSKLDKTRFFKGQKGTYCDLTAFVDLDSKDEYGQSGFITQSPTKEERDQGVKLPIVGNSTVFYKDGANNGTNQQQGYQNQQNPTYGQCPGDLPPQVPMKDNFDDDIPF